METESAAYQRDDGIWVIPKGEFARYRFDYKAGEHVVFAGPTQRGKTTLAFCLLEFAATPELPAMVAVCKPRDPVSEREGKRLGYRRVASWPVAPRFREAWEGKPNGYLVWPKFGDLHTDHARAARITGELIGRVYTNGVHGKQAILVLDDTLVKSKVLKLDDQMVIILAMSGAMGVGGWFFVQKPTDSGRTAIWSYGASEHIFLFRDPDRRNRQRYDEIGGVDPDLVENVTLSLDPYQALYLKRTGSYMCVVDSK